MFALFTTLIILFSFTTQAQCEWVLNEGEEIEDIVLTRMDFGDPDYPYHEEDQGIYGFYEPSMGWVRVMNLQTTFIVYPPYTLDMVEWIPGPMDKYWWQY
jgi:hypothetical protein